MKNQIEETINSCKEQDIVFDIKYFMQDFYFAKFLTDGNAIKVLFDNGQRFKITVRECI